jgi:murein DD-endopeptidase MepM/ murein hydrolase activator NlpD
MSERRRATLDVGRSELSAAEGGTISGRRPMRRGLWPLGTVVLLLSLPLSLPLPAHADDPGSARQAAQQRANRAAARFAQAQTDLAKAESGISDLQARLRRDEQRLVGLRTQVQDLALREYMHGGVGTTLLFDKDVNRLARARAMMRYVTLGDVDSIDRYRATRQDLVATSNRLNSQLKKQRAALAGVQAEQKAALAELDKLTGGRSHQGNDILAARGTPVVANVGGTMQQHPNGLGGNAYFLEGDDGQEYYGAHLDSFSGATGHVPIGTVIGYVGNTGDAAGGPPHLHFEIHPSGHTPTNPYPTLVKYC